MPSADAQSPPSRPVVIVLVGLLCLIWGSTWFVIREGLRDVPPFTSAAARFTVAAILMVPVCGLLSRREGGSRPPFRLSFLVGLLQFALSYGVVYWAEQTLPSALTCMLWAIYPLLMAIAGHFLIPHERLSAGQGIGFLFGFGGVILLFVTDVPRVGDGAILAGGVLLLSPIAVAIATTFIKRAGGGVSSLHLNRDALIVGALFLVAVAFATESPLEVVWTRPALFSVAYLAVIGTVLAFGVYLWVLRYAPANKLSIIPYVSPAVAVVLGVVIGEETISWLAPIGLTLILVGVVLVTRRRGGRAVNVAE